MGMGGATDLTGSIQFTSLLTAERLTRAIMGLCPGGPVGKVLARHGRVLLPRLFTSERITIERRRPGLPSGRIVVSFSPDQAKTLVTITWGAYPAALIVPTLFISALAMAGTRLAGPAAGAVVGGALTALEAMRWRKGLAGVGSDAAWLADELRRADGSIESVLDDDGDDDDAA